MWALANRCAMSHIHYGATFPDIISETIRPPAERVSLSPYFLGEERPRDPDRDGKIVESAVLIIPKPWWKPWDIFCGVHVDIRHAFSYSRIAVRLSSFAGPHTWQRIQSVVHTHSRVTFHAITDTHLNPKTARGCYATSERITRALASFRVNNTRLTCSQRMRLACHTK